MNVSSIFGDSKAARLQGGRRQAFDAVAFTTRTPPLISIVTVVYNAADRLRETINSVLAQSRDGVEYIVIDGASSDETVDVLRQFDHEIDDWISEHDVGIYDAMNKALERCRGEYVHFLNAGDTFYSLETLTHVTALLSLRPALLMNRVNGVETDGGARLLPITLGLTTYRQRFASAYCHQGAFVRTDLLRSVRFDLSYCHFADFYALMKIHALGGSIIETTHLVVNFPLDGVSSNWRKAPELYVEKERLLLALGEGRPYHKYYAGLLRAYLYRFKMSLRSFWNA